MRYVFLNFPLEQIHPLAFKAAEAAECSKKEGKYWEMHDRLFANQQALAQMDLLRYAADLGLDHEAFLTCLNGEMTSKIKEDLALGRKLELSGTPAFLVGDIQSDGTIKLRRRLRGAMRYPAFKTVLEKLLG